MRAILREIRKTEVRQKHKKRHLKPILVFLSSILDVTETKRELHLITDGTRLNAPLSLQRPQMAHSD